MPKTWLITGAGRGFGRQFTQTALERGDNVTATVRDVSALDDLAARYPDTLLVAKADVTDRRAIDTAVGATVDTFTSIDVVVNNAGYGLFGAVEEITAHQLRQQIEVNLIGVLNVTHAVLPHLRRQQSGHLIQISSVGGVAAFPMLGGYHASKWALEGLSEALAHEVAPLGVHVTLVEPTGFATDWAGSSAVHATAQPQYDPLRNVLSSGGGQPQSDHVGAALLEIVDAEHPPLRVLFGEQALRIVEAVYPKRLDDWQRWERTTIRAGGGSA